ncbi:MAG: hypothetical protein HOP15_18890 [Planctomycetes bacterium]|nr:hypothetical protein [Planctomycetota bacterium]
MDDTHFFWCRAWPWFRPEFPFEQFDELDEPAFSAALSAAALRWIEEHPGELPQDRQQQANVFGAVAVRAGWADRPQVFESLIAPRFSPTKRIIFHAVEGAELGKNVLAVLRGRVNAVYLAELSMPAPGRGRFVRCLAPLRYGTIAAGKIDDISRVLVARSLDDFRTSRSPAWAVDIAKEASAIEKHFGAVPPLAPLSTDLPLALGELGAPRVPAEQGERVVEHSSNDGRKGPEAGVPEAISTGEQSKLRGEALDVAAAALLRKNPSWTRARIAKELRVPRQRLYDAGKLPTLELVEQHLSAEKAERAQRLSKHNVERRDLLGTDTDCADK